ncbi:MAG: PSD1 and planctomycete cytochrome C domain-containing protein [Verrucomicrobiales bacterium]|nr:PSD1 and planctomycete cytochrome C domain-containing protein [Verrucomicrobiales bacterium]
MIPPPARLLFLIPTGLVVMAIGMVAIAEETAVPARPIDFNRDIRPILSDKCFFCHGPDSHERKADLRLDTEEGALADLGGYAAIVPGKPEESELVLRLTDKDDPMPPVDSHKKLKPAEIALLTRWVSEGGEFSEPWAYVPPKKHEAPAVKDTKWPANVIDAFVLARLESEKLSPSPDADRVTLIRRLAFDLTGLPPTPEEVAAFVNAEGDFERVWQAKVDEFLASPRFGERLAIYWLDLVRYADTVGYHGDQDHNISPYRDWVIRSLNANMPFDQFTREQLAGDLLPDPDINQKVASGYNRLLQTTHEGGLQKKEYDAIYAADRVRNVSAVWMGATVGCAQCHDHKYDPYTIKDHYSLAAFFSDIHDEGFAGNSLPSLRPPEIPVPSPEEKEQIADLREKIEEILPADVRKLLETQEVEKTKLEAALKKKGTPEQMADWNKHLAAANVVIRQAAPEAKRAGWKRLRADLAAAEKAVRKTMITVAKPPRTMRVLPRGNWQDESGGIVRAAVPSFLGKVEPAKGDHATRLDLANWLTDPETGGGGLTARVFANRFWYLFFGTGISRSLSDFGGQGEAPANPELLDYLAVEFYESGWDIKSIFRLMGTSRAYRQSSLASPELRERDPFNQLVARQSRYRLPAEIVRDNALAISGLLVLEEGGAGAKPYQPAGYYRHLNFPQRKYTAHSDSNQWRRGVYVHWQRQFLHPMLKAMDAPSREECTAERPHSNTPTAALVLLNDPTFIEAARVFAARILAEGGNETSSRINYAFRLALSREADAEERKLLENLLAKTRGEYESNPAAAQRFLETGLAPLPEAYASVELASWTSVARAVLNLNESITRN